MNSAQAKQIKITDYLHTLGVNPKEIKGNDYWYHSPFRSERTASFKVNNQLNIWSDYGSGEGGNILDLVMVLHSIPTISGALAHLSGRSISALPTDSFSFQQQKEISSGMSNIKTMPIFNPILIEYIKTRGIDLELAKQYCCEVHYQAKGKEYFAIGFRNNGGGYALSNPIPFKGSTSPNDITIFQNPKDTKENCLVFEGFWDFLSFLKLKNLKETSHNVVVLNSVSNLSKAIHFIKLHDKVYTYLDHDDAGRKTTQEIKSACKSHSDQSEFYRGFKDLNDYLCGNKIESLQTIKHENSLSNNQVSKPETEQPKPAPKPIRRMKL